MARFYANENVSEPVIFELRRLGHDVVTMRETGHAGRAMPDIQVLDLATANGRAGARAVQPDMPSCRILR
jgi:hypothetical protein